MNLALHLLSCRAWFGSMLCLLARSQVYLLHLRTQASPSEEKEGEDASDRELRVDLKVELDESLPPFLSLTFDPLQPPRETSSELSFFSALKQRT